MIDRALATASMTLCLAVFGCVAQPGSPHSKQEAMNRKMAMVNGGAPEPAPPSGVALPPIGLDEEVVVSVGSTFVFQMQPPPGLTVGPTTLVSRVVAIQGDQITMSCTTYAKGTSSTSTTQVWTKPNAPARSVATDVVQVAAGTFRCTMNHQHSPQSDFTTWIPIGWRGGFVKSVMTSQNGVFTTELIRIENATTRPRSPAEPVATQGSLTLGVTSDEDAGEGRGVPVVSVTAGGPAERGGLETGDVIEQLGGRPTPDLKSLHHAVAGSSGRVSVSVLRRGKEIELVVGLPEAPGAPAAAVTPAPPKVESLPAATGDTYVLAIGVNEYDDARIPKLRFAEQDARAVYGFYATSRRSPTAQDRVLLLAGKDATRTGILKAIREHLERKATRPEDTVVFYFGGHGFSDADDTYLAASDTQLDSLRETGLSSATLREYWTKIRAGRKVLIMDACHAGGIDGMRGTRGVGGVRITGGPGAEPPIAQDTATAAPSTTLVIAATGPNELSTEDSGLGHGVFTRVLLNGLAGEADEDKDGRVTGEELGRYLVREVPGVARGFGGNQTPVVTGGGPAILLTR